MWKSCFCFGLLSVSFGLVCQSSACSTFVLHDGRVVLFARNFDWDWGDGFIVVNKRGIAKTAYVRHPEKPARWTSKYGSVTFNQFGRERPFGGINETGLVIELSMLYASKYPAPDQRPAVDQLQWIQYQLDNCRSVEEVLATNKHVRIETPTGEERSHYLVCDATGDTATVEFLDGEMVVHRGDKLGSKALTNNSYQESADFAADYAVSHGDELPAGPRSIHRFARAAKCSREFRTRSPKQDREYAFRHLNDVAQEFTVWSIVYDISNRKVFFRTADNNKLRWFSLSEFDFSPSLATVALDVNAPGDGDVSRDFREFSNEQHEQFLVRFFGKSDVIEAIGDRRAYMRGLCSALRRYRPKSQKNRIEAGVP